MIKIKPEQAEEYRAMLERVRVEMERRIARECPSWHCEPLGILLYESVMALEKRQKLKNGKEDRAHILSTILSYPGHLKAELTSQEADDD